eukprot:TRINITY_DN9509_c0_g1_i1.p1 TRINITY_DN9509_c0_g1~~TRINITY_DN9509_c0_g1_i1.p1  ORF type:complete len:899 (+),score=177.39 TRINITY_DN9509_c0_g1_i1:130-2697(+)
MAAKRSQLDLQRQLVLAQADWSSATMPQEQQKAPAIAHQPTQPLQELQPHQAQPIHSSQHARSTQIQQTPQPQPEHVQSQPPQPVYRQSQIRREVSTNPVVIHWNHDANQLSHLQAPSRQQQSGTSRLDASRTLRKPELDAAYPQQQQPSSSVRQPANQSTMAQQQLQQARLRIARLEQEDQALADQLAAIAQQKLGNSRRRRSPSRRLKADREGRGLSAQPALAADGSSYNSLRHETPVGTEPFSEQQPERTGFATDHRQATGLRRSSSPNASVRKLDLSRRNSAMHRSTHSTDKLAAAVQVSNELSALDAARSVRSDATTPADLLALPFKTANIAQEQQAPLRTGLERVDTALARSATSAIGSEQAHPTFATAANAPTSRVTSHVSSQLHIASVPSSPVRQPYTSPLHSSRRNSLEQAPDLDPISVPSSPVRSSNRGRSPPPARPGSSGSGRPASSPNRLALRSPSLRNTADRAVGGPGRDGDQQSLSSQQQQGSTAVQQPAEHVDTFRSNRSEATLTPPESPSRRTVLPAQSPGRTALNQLSAFQSRSPGRTLASASSRRASLVQPSSPVKATRSSSPLTSRRSSRSQSPARVMPDRLPERPVRGSQGSDRSPIRSRQDGAVSSGRSRAGSFEQRASNNANIMTELQAMYSQPVAAPTANPPSPQAAVMGQSRPASAGIQPSSRPMSAQVAIHPSQLETSDSELDAAKSESTVSSIVSHASLLNSSVEVNSAGQQADAQAAAAIPATTAHPAADIPDDDPLAKYMALVMQNREEQAQATAAPQTAEDSYGADSFEQFQVSGDRSAGSAPASSPLKSVSSATPIESSILEVSHNNSASNSVKGLSSNHSSGMW